METGMLHLHKLAVTLFVLIYLIKASLAVFKKHKSYERFSKATKIPGMVISVVFLLTGIYLATKMESFDTWLIVKIVAIMVAIPLAIVASKKQNLYLELLAFVLLIYIYAASETRSPVLMKAHGKDVITDPNAVGYDLLKHGNAVYSIECRRCHGEDGTLQKMKATNLATSALSAEASTQIIQKGGTAMPAFGKKLKPHEVEAVVQYLQTLRK